jgi:hypothetical protein
VISISSVENKQFEVLKSLRQLLTRFWSTCSDQDLIKENTEKEYLELSVNLIDDIFKFR